MTDIKLAGWVTALATATIGNGDDLANAGIIAQATLFDGTELTLGFCVWSDNARNWAGMLAEFADGKDQAADAELRELTEGDGDGG